MEVGVTLTREELEYSRARQDCCSSVAAFSEGVVASTIDVVSETTTVRNYTFNVDGAIDITVSGFKVLPRRMNVHITIDWTAGHVLPRTRLVSVSVSDEQDLNVAARLEDIPLWLRAAVERELGSVPIAPWSVWADGHMTQEQLSDILELTADTSTRHEQLDRVFSLLGIPPAPTGASHQDPPFTIGELHDFAHTLGMAVRL